MVNGKKSLSIEKQQQQQQQLMKSISFRSVYLLQGKRTLGQGVPQKEDGNAGQQRLKGPWFRAPPQISGKNSGGGEIN